MQCLPFPEYAHPQGSLNVANYLTEDLIKPDLGPKSYIATGRYAPPSTLPTHKILSSNSNADSALTKPDFVSVACSLIQCVRQKYSLHDCWHV